jgi:hypothetical protein
MTSTLEALFSWCASTEPRFAASHLCLAEIPLGSLCTPRHSYLGFALSSSSVTPSISSTFRLLVVPETIRTDRFATLSDFATNSTNAKLPALLTAGAAIRIFITPSCPATSDLEARGCM